jgi:hypothetical protein
MNTENNATQEHEANFSILVMSIASTALMSLGLAPQENGEVSKDMNLARFNIDLLLMLKEKTKNNLNAEETRFIDSVVNDLQSKYVSNN